jgi:hypothetical protein
VEIERLGYSRKSRRRYRTTWEHLVAFADRKQLGDEFSGELVARFLKEYRVGGEELGPGEGWRRHLVWSLKVLADFAKDGHIERGRTEVAAIQLVPAMQRTLRDYEQFCRDRLHVQPTTAEILGHTSLESTRIYAKADVEALRAVALDPEEVNHVA